MNILARIMAFSLSTVMAFSVAAGEIAITFDDAPMPDTALMRGEKRTNLLIEALQDASIPDVLFYVKTDNITPANKDRLGRYTQAGFHLANHSHSHQSANEIPANDYLTDVFHAHLILKNFTNLLPYHRFPYLHPGADKISIDKIQAGLAELGYLNGYVTVDNFDWYLNAALIKAVEDKKVVDYKKLRKIYVEVMWQAIIFYDDIAKKSLGRSPKHVLLLHENDMAALFITDVITHIRAQGWKIISPQEAYADPIAKIFPNVLFHKQGRVAAIAHGKGVPESELRHPAENIEYLDKLLQEKKVFQ